MNTSTSSSLNASPTAAPGLPASVQSQPQVDPDSAVTGPAPQRALVLGGGGSTGNAWLIGVIAGLFDAGLDVTNADLTVGTSAGSTAAAQLAGATPTELFDAIVAAAPQGQAGHVRSGRVGSGVAGSGTRPVVVQMERTGNIMNASADMADMPRRLGAAAIDMAEAMEGSSARWRATVATRLPQAQWPERDILLTAVDARTGDPVTFHRHSGVDLVDAVAASCASGFAYSIGSNQYIDGGYRANAENADLAAGHARVLVLAPFGGRTRTPLEWGMHLAGQVEALRANGSQVETVFPTNESEHMFGVKAMDLSLRPSAARAGFQQGKALAPQLADFWG
ncbi:patatin-like phospholipase family protein [Arthrobacter sp. YN]|uniref:patatin-like phospholipase family protein n=1 Tax=Arthrobacter sp. YN TaxID=2020486 RepID=UPI000B5EC066|nr:patatin-like phospholipase family protein [Arthrobacter sp. YN]ASN21858.1 patatin [Arthrobacter sp. YN]